MKRWFVWLMTAAFLFILSNPVEPTAPASALTPVADQSCEETKYVALTFDDGPRSDTTSRLLDGLLERGVHATFFVIGEQIEGNEDLLLRMAAEGHQVGNHTFSHVRLQDAPATTIVEEIQKTEVLLEELLGEGEYWLRPPYGLVDSRCTHLVQTPMLYWSLDPEDWRVLDTQKVTEHILSQVKNGDIILLHDFYPTSVDAALEVVDTLSAQGYQFLTVEELFCQFGTDPQPGALYANATDERNW